jgi:2'-5' RNA ligase superfamily
MQGIVSLLDGEARERIEQLWDELRRDFGVRGIHSKRFPHFSYHVADEYDLVQLRPTLEQLAGSMRQFAAQASGIGIFTRKEPVIYLPVVRSAEMQRVHGDIARLAEPLTTGFNEFYAPEIWIPHTTIAEGDVDILVLPEIVRRLGERNLRWAFPVTNLAVIRASESVQEICFRCEIGA